MIAGINEILVEDTEIIALIGNNAAGTKIKVFPIVAPAGESFPYITTSLAQYTPTNTKRESNTLDYPKAAIHVHATSYDSVDEISDRVISLFDVQAFTTDAGYTFEKTWIENAFDRPELFTSDHPAYVRTIVVNTQIRR